MRNLVRMPLPQKIIKDRIAWGCGFATFFEKKVAPKNFWAKGVAEVYTNTSKTRLYMKTKAFVYGVLQRIARAIFWVPPPQKIIKVRFVRGNSIWLG